MPLPYQRQRARAAQHRRRAFLAGWQQTVTIRGIGSVDSHDRPCNHLHACPWHNNPRKSRNISRKSARRVRHLSPSSRGRRPATPRSTRSQHPTHSNTYPRRSPTSIDCPLAFPMRRLFRNCPNSPNRRVQKCTSPRAAQRCAPLAASPTTPAHLLRRRRPRKVPTQGQRRLAEFKLRRKPPRAARAHKQSECHLRRRDTFPAPRICR